MNEEDIWQQGLQDGDIVDLYNEQGGIQRVAHRFIVVPYPIPRGCAATYYPETNVLVPIASVADKSNTPVSKLVVIPFQHPAPSRTPPPIKKAAHIHRPSII